MMLLRTNGLITLTIVALALTGCAGVQEQPQMTPLEIQSMQTREYETPAKIVFASVISALQDLGYTIKDADSNTGFINAESTTQQAGDGGVDWQKGLREAARRIHKASGGSGMTIADKIDAYNKDPMSSMKQITATAFVEEISNRTHVRLNFVEQSGRRDARILDVKSIRTRLKESRTPYLFGWGTRPVTVRETCL